MRTLLALLILFSSNLLIAQEPKEKPLPPPGTWVSYRVLLNSPGLDRSGHLSHRTLTLRLMEPVIHAGINCRWVEFDWDIHAPQARRRIVNRYLIPEQSLLESQHPYQDVKIAISGEATAIGILELQQMIDKNGELPLQKIERQEISSTFLNTLDKKGWELLFFPGIQANTELREADEQISYRRGRLDCQKQLEGQRLRVISFNEQKDDDHRTTHVVNYTIYQHNDVPFGVAGADFRFQKFAWHHVDTEHRRRDQLPAMQWRLQDFGTDGISPFLTD